MMDTSTMFAIYLILIVAAMIFCFVMVGHIIVNLIVHIVLRIQIMNMKKRSKED